MYVQSSIVVYMYTVYGKKASLYKEGEDCVRKRRIGSMWYVVGQRRFDIHHQLLPSHQ